MTSIPPTLAGGTDAGRSAPSPTAPPTMVARIAALRAMNVAQLREEYLAAFGEPTRSRNREWIFGPVARQIQALAEGGLSERAKRRAEELARDCDVRLRRLAPAPVATPASQGPTRVVRMPLVRDERLPLPGSVPVRKYLGRDITVQVLEDGFAYEGRGYRSLTAIAEAVTGSCWSGTAFFGLAKAAAKEATR